jgi:hypothetical protein
MEQPPAFAAINGAQEDSSELDNGQETKGAPVCSNFLPKTYRANSIECNVREADGPIQGPPPHIISQACCLFEAKLNL